MIWGFNMKRVLEGRHAISFTAWSQAFAEASTSAWAAVCGGKTGRNHVPEHGEYRVIQTRELDSLAEAVGLGLESDVAIIPKEYIGYLLQRRCLSVARYVIP